MKEDDISWQGMLYDLVRQEEMDPWNIDIAKLCDKFVKNVLKLKETNLMVSGKIVYACALLLKIKSKYLLENGLKGLDNLFDNINGTNETYEEDDSEIDNTNKIRAKEIQKKLFPRTPQPRERRVSIYDLIDALGKTLEVKNKFMHKIIPKVKRVHIPLKKMDISLLIKDVYRKIRNNNDEKLNFSQLLPENEFATKKDKIFTFMPLLHLHNLRKIHLIQKKDQNNDFEVLHLRKGINAPEEEYEIFSEKQQKLKINVTNK